MMSVSDERLPSITPDALLINVRPLIVPTPSIVVWLMRVPPLKLPMISSLAQSSMTTPPPVSEVEPSIVVVPCSFSVAPASTFRVLPSLLLISRVTLRKMLTPLTASMTKLSAVSITPLTMVAPTRFTEASGPSVWMLPPQLST